MTMTLARDVPQRIAGALRGQLTDVFRRADVDPAEIKNTLFAIHPGGPKIIDGVRKVLELDEALVAASQAVLRAYGNMSSATLPHLWARMAADRAVAPGTLIASLAFGPGLTMCAALFRKQ
jgi:predicted naringenin-chalcone synthase